jgi:sulfate adenylyltransferase
VRAADPIAPYGGRLVDRVVDPAAAEVLRAEAARLPAVQLSSRVATDLYLLAVGALSPLEGFMDREQYDRVLDDMSLPTGLPWSIPVVRSVPVSARRFFRPRTNPSPCST